MVHAWFLYQMNLCVQDKNKYRRREILCNLISDLEVSDTAISVS